ncbi:MAG: tRNA (adenosine(37)-N6)-threonylcarbamoyltransferase complex dimerization subunit type 1 TsaB [Pseudomonadales bacterium]|nr:tRNA (adenosine(37)-N6)-threonylcarbamoyltransferase complex dimerization subunit type 1 TsaB [Pseudomonadales bacterium]
MVTIHVPLYRAPAIRMTTLLAIDTSGALCSVALLHAAAEFADTRHLVRQHNRVLLEMIDGLCARAGILPRALERVAYVNGPGSFTGVRLAVAAVQGILVATGARALGVSTSRLLAAHAAATPVRSVVTMVHSRANSWYLAGYERVSPAAAFERVHDDTLVDALPDWCVGYDACIGGLPAWWHGEAIAIEPDPQPGLTLLRLAAADMGSAAWSDVAGVLPVYVDGDHPWVPSTPAPSSPE